MHHLPTATVEPNESTPGCRTWRVGAADMLGDGDVVAVRELDPGFAMHVSALPEVDRAFVVLSGQLMVGASTGEREARARSVVFLPASVGCRLSVTAPTRLLWVASTAAAGPPVPDLVSDPVVSSIDDIESTTLTEPEMGLFDIESRALVTSDTAPARAVLLGHSCFASVDGRHELHRHDRDEFLYGVAGTAHLLSDQGESVLEPGDLVHVPAGEWHGLRAMAGEELSEHLFGYLGVASYVDAGYALYG